MLDPVEAARFVKQAEMVEYLTRKVKAAEEVQRQAAEVVLRAKRRLGELLATTEKSVGGRPEKNRLPRAPVSRTLSEMGISKRASTDASTVANIPEAEFERYVAGSPRPSVRGVIASQAPGTTSKPSLEQSVANQFDKILGSSPEGVVAALLAGSDYRTVLGQARRLRAWYDRFDVAAHGGTTPERRNGDEVPTFFKGKK
jgi:hypothetical protein